MDNALDGQPVFDLIFLGNMTEEHFSWVPEQAYGFNSHQRRMRSEGEWFHGNVNSDREWTIAIFPDVHPDPDYFYWEEAEVYIYDSYNPRENIGFAFGFTTDIPEDLRGGIRDVIVDYIRLILIPLARIRNRQHYLPINLQ